MLLPGSRPGGARLAPSSEIKIKGLQIQRRPDEPTVADMFDNWRWESNLRPQIDLALGQGANCVKFASSIDAVLSGRISEATHDTRARQFIEYALARRAYVYWCPHFYQEDAQPAGDPDTLAQIVRSAQLLAGYPNVIGMDCSNEANLGYTRAQVITNQQAVYPVIKDAAPALPLTVSLLINQATDYLTMPFAELFDYVDFWDFHPYYFAGAHVPPADLDAFRAGPYFKRWLIGECGAGAGLGPTVQANRWLDLGVLAAEPDSFGAVGYTTSDILTGDEDHGLYTSAGVERRWMTERFHAWPAHR